MMMPDIEGSSLAGEYERAEEAATFIRQGIGLHPRIAVVLGSGLGNFADELADTSRIPYSLIPHFPSTTVKGHTGELVVGRLGGIEVGAMRGRVHLYEGYSAREVSFPIRVLGRLGIQALVLTNACGGINANYAPGSLVILKDHINLQGANPLIGPNDDRFGPRFPDMTHAYTKRYRELAFAEARASRIDVHEGVYVGLAGPSYETPAEIRAFRTMGADVVGMSTVAEAIVARHMGMKILAISCVANRAADITSEELRHHEVLAVMQRSSDALLKLLRAVLPKIEADLDQPRDVASH